MTALVETGWAPTKGGVLRWTAENFPEPDEAELSQYGWASVNEMTCKLCGAGFSSSSAARRYCSETCRKAARREQQAISDAKRLKDGRKQIDRRKIRQQSRGPLPVDCPRCGALAGAVCRTPAMEATRQHDVRIKAMAHKANRGRENFTGELLSTRP